jgi:5-methylcytosine-specific restriction endonuclease McrA
MTSINNREKKLKLLFKKQRGRCWICNGMMARDTITFDHIIPKSKGGLAELENLKLAHACCNSRRGSSMDGVLIHCGGAVAMRYQAAR